MSSMPSADAFSRYEDGEMTEDEVIEFFQKLINTGWCWRLQGHYGRTAMALIENGLCSRA